jgi:hypothetical protein
MNIWIKALLLLVVLNFLLPLFALTVTIGTGTIPSRYPIAFYYSYERSANIYLANEINAFGTITSLAWLPTESLNPIVPVKIYLKSTTATVMTSGTWNSLISDATLVFDGNVNNFIAANWKIVDINDWAYTQGNLMVLVESNYGNGMLS